MPLLITLFFSGFFRNKAIQVAFKQLSKSNFIFLPDYTLYIYENASICR